MHEPGKIVFLHIPPILGVDMSITNDVVLILAAGLTTFLLLFFACRRKEECARGPFQNFFEAIIEFIDKEVVVGMVGPNAGAWAPFILTVFFFILFCNMMGFIPYPAVFKPATSNINITAALAVAVFLTSQFADIYLHGFFGFIKRVVPKGVPGFIAPFVFLLEMAARLARPFSLTLRLFCNMMVGHTIVFTFIALGMASSSYLVKTLPLIGTIMMSAFELFVCFLQAFVFTILTGSYIGEAVQESH